MNRWLGVFVYLVALYAILPFTIPVTSWAKSSRLSGLTPYAAPILLTVGGGVLLWRILRRKRKRLWVILAGFGGVGFLYVLMMVYLVQVPVERFHVLLFAGLTLIVYQSYQKTAAGFRLYAYTAAFVSCVSFIDEVIQGFMPSRLYDNRDILLNVGSAALILILLRLFDTAADEKSPRPQGPKDYAVVAGFLLLAATMFLLRRTPMDSHRIVGEWVAQNGCGSSETMAFTETGEVVWTDELGNESKGLYTVKGNPFGENVFSIEATATNNASACGWQKGWKGSNLIFFEEESFRLLNHQTSWIRKTK